MIKVYMSPLPDKLGESGIRRVIEAYRKYLPAHGFEFVDTDIGADLITSHAASYPEPQVLHCHGLYWTGDFPLVDGWQWLTNAHVIAAVRHAKVVTVPSAWVAESFQRDMRFNPRVIPHGIEWQDWEHNEENRGYVLWNKNRSGIDVCDNSILLDLMKRFPKINFLSTFSPRGLDSAEMGNWPKNLKITENGVIPHAQMQLMIQRAGVYLSTTKETFGIGVLEAMAAGVPVLGYSNGGNLELIQHGVNGYLAYPDDFDDLCAGLNYCLQHRATLGANGVEMSKKWGWEGPISEVAALYKSVLEDDNRPVHIEKSTYKIF